MDNENRYRDWEKDFVEFLDSPEVSPPRSVSANVVNVVSAKLNPSPLFVFAKLVLVVLVSGSASLLICPQLGFGSDIGLMRFFMSYGPLGCRAACGGFFMLFCIVSTCLILRPEELTVLRRTRFLSISAVCALSLGAFLCASPDVLLSVALAWFFGASVSGILSLEIGYRARIWFLASRYADA